mmetsp:Transcript_94065/g.186482  ORF Transcript_94065/g.186482 Transcript_94065/m.186482 type:complete len:314 (+) Transcript_94065:54-995(+)
MKVCVACFLISAGMGGTSDSDGCCAGTYLTDPKNCPNSNAFLPGQRCCPGLAEWWGQRIKCWNPPTPAPTLHCTSSSCMKHCRVESDCGQEESCTVMQSVPGPWGSPYSVCMGHNISNGRFCRSDDDCASKQCAVQSYRDGFDGMCTDPTTTTTTLHCTSSDCMRRCQAASDCGEGESCTAIFRTSGPWGGPYSVCMGHDISHGHFCLVDDDCASKICSIQKRFEKKRGMCVGAPTTDGQPALAGFGFGGTGVVAFGLIVGSAAMCLRRRQSKARETGSGNHSLIRAFPKDSVTETMDVTARAQFPFNSPDGV